MINMAYGSDIYMWFLPQISFLFLARIETFTDEKTATFLILNEELSIY